MKKQKKSETRKPFHIVRIELGDVWEDAVIKEVQARLDRNMQAHGFKKITGEEIAKSLADIVQAEKTPPLAAQYVLYWFLPKKQRDGLLGDLSEEYAEAVAKFGKKAADVLFCKQVLQSLSPLFWQMLVRAVRLYEHLHVSK